MHWKATASRCPILATTGGSRKASSLDARLDLKVRVEYGPPYGLGLGLGLRVRVRVRVRVSTVLSMGHSKD
jgi:hypothetical protein